MLSSRNIIFGYQVAYDEEQSHTLIDSNNRANELIKEEEKAYKSMKRLLYTDKVLKLLGKDVDVVIDRPIGYKNDGIEYKQNLLFYRP